MPAFFVGTLLHRPPGSQEDYDFDERMELPPEDGLKLDGNVSGHVQLLKLPHEINVQISDVKAEAVSLCSRCLKDFSYPLRVDCVEAEFNIDLEESELQEGEEAYAVDLNTNQVVLDEMIRTELLLHFPSVAVCSPRCKGLCDRCGINLNEKTCSCVRTESGKIHPFKLL